MKKVDKLLKKLAEKGDCDIVIKMSLFPDSKNMIIPAHCGIPESISCMNVQLDVVKHGVCIGTVCEYSVDTAIESAMRFFTAP